MGLPLCWAAPFLIARNSQFTGLDYESRFCAGTIERRKEGVWTDYCWSAICSLPWNILAGWHRGNRLLIRLS